MVFFVPMFIVVSLFSFFSDHPLGFTVSCHHIFFDMAVPSFGVFLLNLVLSSLVLGFPVCFLIFGVVIVGSPVSGGRLFLLLFWRVVIGFPARAILIH